MQFLYQPLTWGFLLVVVPLLIHLINLSRQQKVKWAAMEFLLAANKKHRKWIWLRQFLLLATRMLAVAILVAMLAHLVTRNQWSMILGGSTTHHIVVLDDSMSMSEQTEVASPIQKAESVLERLTDRIADAEWGQQMTIIRTSQAARLPDGDAERDPLAAATQVADVFRLVVDGEFESKIAEIRGNWEPTELSVRPNQALDLVSQLIATNDQERPVVYLISDFRNEGWNQPVEQVALIQKLEKQGARINLVRCAQQSGSNLAITKLQPTGGTRAAGVPLFVELDITNFGRTASQPVSVAIRSTHFGNDAAIDDPASSKGETTELPAVQIDSIPPGGTTNRRVQVYFAGSGYHVVDANLPADVLASDNHRWCVVDFPDDIPVAVIDGDPARQNASYLTSVFQPSQRVETGVRAVEQPLTFLRDSSEQQLDQFRVIYLLDVPRLDAQSQANLQGYLERGGGVAIFVGPNTNINFCRGWYDDGRGLFPLPLQRVVMNSRLVSSAPSLMVEDHPIFRVLLGEGNPFASQVRIQQFIRPPENWQPDDQSSTRILARLGDGQPIAVEKSVGNGRLVTFLTTLAPEWNSWAMQPSFVVVLLELQAYLYSGSAPIQDRTVGSDIAVDVDAQQFQKEVVFRAPGPDGTRLEWRREATSIPSAPLSQMSARLGVEFRERLTGRTDTAGIYEAWRQSIAGERSVQRFALNVDNRESDLRLAEETNLADSISGTDARIFSADELSLGDDTTEGVPWSTYLFWALVSMLLIEQLLGYFASYHPIRKGALA